MTHIDVHGTIREIDQEKLTSDCWLVQFSGLDECKKCPARGTVECGGGETLRKMQNGEREQLGKIVGQGNPADAGYQEDING
jgi:hypothetical protein